MTREEVIGGLVEMIVWCVYKQKVGNDSDKKMYKEHEEILYGALKLLGVPEK